MVTWSLCHADASARRHYQVAAAEPALRLNATAAMAPATRALRRSHWSAMRWRQSSRHAATEQVANNYGSSISDRTLP